MKLSVLDRIIIMNDLIVKESNFLGIRIAKSIKEKIDFSIEEISMFKFQQQINPETNKMGLFWDKSKEATIDVFFTAIEMATLKEQIKKMDAENKITEQNINLFDMILEEKIN